MDYLFLKLIKFTRCLKVSSFIMNTITTIYPASFASRLSIRHQATIYLPMLSLKTIVSSGLPPYPFGVPHFGFLYNDHYGYISPKSRTSAPSFPYQHYQEYGF